MNSPEKTRLLQQIAAIPAMERGKLSPHASDRHHKLQRWQADKNHTRHVPADELPAVQSALDGYTHYRQLTEQYADFGRPGNPPAARGRKKSRWPDRNPSRPRCRNPGTDRPLEAEELPGQGVAQLEVLVRSAVFKSANALIGWLLQRAADRAFKARLPGRNPMLHRASAEIQPLEIPRSRSNPIARQLGFKYV